MIASLDPGLERFMQNDASCPSDQQLPNWQLPALSGKHGERRSDTMPWDTIFRTHMFDLLMYLVFFPQTWCKRKLLQVRTST